MTPPFSSSSVFPTPDSGLIARFPLPNSGTNQLTWEDTADGTSSFLRSGVVTLWVLAPNSADAKTLEWLLLGEPAGLDG